MKLPSFQRSNHIARCVLSLLHVLLMMEIQDEMWFQVDSKSFSLLCSVFKPIFVLWLSNPNLSPVWGGVVSTACLRPNAATATTSCCSISTSTSISVRSSGDDCSCSPVSPCCQPVQPDPGAADPTAASGQTEAASGASAEEDRAGTGTD